MIKKYKNTDKPRKNSLILFKVKPQLNFGYLKDSKIVFGYKSGEKFKGQSLQSYGYKEDEIEFWSYWVDIEKLIQFEPFKIKEIKKIDYDDLRDKKDFHQIVLENGGIYRRYSSENWKLMIGEYFLSEEYSLNEKETKELENTYQEFLNKK